MWEATKITTDRAICKFDGVWTNEISLWAELLLKYVLKSMKKLLLKIVIKTVLFNKLKINLIKTHF